MSENLRSYLYGLYIKLKSKVNCIGNEVSVDITKCYSIAKVIKLIIFIFIIK